jgi:hypothetical protein
MRAHHRKRRRRAAYAVAMDMRQCESCGREFACGARSEDGCWCDALLVSPQQLAVLREHFLACVCPDCLRVAAAANA